ncbi:tRNA threonylcarbamoyladenosine dehydratase [Sulfurospirillum arcachonense]|uniref:tRNA threonylcarbamoyladenosine dehydratase n=1 Tax=Sulfurospirillum arcachonense TaxID=57666 RepID=UPI0004697AC2|nr:tRNA threonylcarbamoyladenosine dehydratase [Sulfurospirillum arcachonense]
MDDRFSRSRLLFQDDFEKLQKAKILLLGVGGVGGFCLDALYRAGIGSITIIDFDTFEITNQNRQLGSEAIGMIKVERMKELYAGIEGFDLKITPQWVEEFDFEPFDLVIDAIDDMPAKVAIAQKVSHKLISSMGGAKKMDPTKIEITNIWKTHGDGLAKKFRYELKKVGFKKKFDVVFSPELPNCQGLGSFVGVTGSFGLTLSSLAIRKLLNS